jgi:hypothetical protein
MFKMNWQTRRMMLEAPVEGAGGGDEGDTIDLGSFVPETFKGEDGKYDTVKFREQFDTMTAAQQQAQERLDALPKSADEYAFSLPEGHALPEGLDLTALATKDEQGNDVPFDVNSIIAADDPDVKVLQELMHSVTTGETDPKAAMQKMAGLMVNRELGQIKKAMDTAKEEAKALGPDGGKARIETLKREAAARLPAEQASALMDSLTSANSIRAVEALIKKSAITPGAGGNGAPDYSAMSPDERIMAGLKARSAK